VVNNTWKGELQIFQWLQDKISTGIRNYRTESHIFFAY